MSKATLPPKGVAPAPQGCFHVHGTKKKRMQQILQILNGFRQQMSADHGAILTILLAHVPRNLAQLIAAYRTDALMDVVDRSLGSSEVELAFCWTCGDPSGSPKHAP